MGQWRCKICPRSYCQDDGSGYSNLIAHLRPRYPDFEERIRLASVSETGSLLNWVSQRVHTRLGWISWVVEEGLPLTFCEKPATRRNKKLAPISHVTMRDNILRVTEAVEDKVAQEIPDNFGIIFDGWSNDSEHYLAVFATYEVDRLVKTPLLSMAPIVNEPDDNLKAESHRSALESVLVVFGKELVHCLFLV
ncbi:hypothetical protein PC111_g23829 [Phytophthora cactorum]|nr:hypothetical protein PC111_g23829 [Phytophthora cactorum]KAG2876633.1 hypothetical protein PC115_g23568 [Phytophthora cactorum]KAG4059716.1 hypothetical protein PC123_g5346 [Phytophthora cactorum]